MDSIIKTLSSLISSSSDRSLNKELLSIQKKVERVKTREREKLRKQVHKALERENPLDLRDEKKHY